MPAGTSRVHVILPWVKQNHNKNLILIHCYRLRLLPFILQWHLQNASPQTVKLSLSSWRVGRRSERRTRIEPTRMPPLLDKFDLYRRSFATSVPVRPDNPGRTRLLNVSVDAQRRDEVHFHNYYWIMARPGGVGLLTWLDGGWLKRWHGLYDI